MKFTSLKLTILKTLIYFLAKYIIFYLFLAVKNNDFYFFEVSNMKYFMYWWLLLSLSLFCFLIFCIPIFLVLKSKNKSIFITFFLLMLVSEYLIYTYLESQLDLLNGIYNEIIGLLLFIVIFYKQIKIVFAKNTQYD